MADPKQFDYLIACLTENSGRRAWLAQRKKMEWLDLSSGDLSGKPLRGFDLTGANLSTALLEKTDLTKALLANANLTLSLMEGACLREASLERANLTGSNASCVDAADARFENATCYNCNFSGANLIGADFGGADLREADFTGACLKYARLSGALLDGANVKDADMTGCVLDPDTPGKLKNFRDASIDDRRFRTLNSQFSELFGEIEETEAVFAGLPVATNKRERTEEPPPMFLGPTHGGAGDTAAPAEAAPKNGGASEQTAAGQDSQTGGASPFETADQSVDLTTVEGCCMVLGISPDASMDEVAKAFRKKAKIYHPDKVRHLNQRLQEVAAEEFRRLHAAYEMLTRKSTRPLDGIVWAAGVPRKASPYEYTSAEYEQLYRMNPKNPAIIYNLAWKYFEEGRPLDAKLWFEKLLEINPNDADAEFNIMVIRLYLEVQVPMLGG